MLGNPRLFAEGTAGLPTLPHFRPKARRAIWLFPAGAPSQIDPWDYKPKLREMFGKDLPDSVRGNQRLTTMTSGQKRFPVAPSVFKFAQHGQSGTWVSELLPWTAKMVDEIAVVRSLHTEAINHEPATIAVNSGNQLPGRPCLGSWLSYGLGTPQREPPHLRRDDLHATPTSRTSRRCPPGCGAAASFRPSTPASPCAARAIRCST